MYRLIQTSSVLLFLACGSNLVAGQAAAALGALPSCAKPCAATLPANCNLDVKCICADTAYLDSVSCCIAKVCSEADIVKTGKLSQQLCDTVNVNIPATIPASCAATSAAAAAAAPSSSMLPLNDMSGSMGNGTMKNGTMGMAGATTTGASGSSATSKASSSTGTASSSAKPAGSSGGAMSSAVTAGQGLIAAVGGAVAALAFL